MSDPLHRIEKLSEEFFRRKHEGEALSIKQFANAHPDCREELVDFLEAMCLVADLKARQYADGSQGATKNQTSENLDATMDGVLKPQGDLLKQQPSGLPNIPDYRLIRELGRGAMGVVYAAEQQSLGRQVALKTILSSQSSTPQMRARFQHEARTASRLHHPNIVPIYDIGESNDTIYYAMQLIEGLGLDQVLESACRILNSKAPSTDGLDDKLANRLISGLDNTDTENNPDKGARKATNQSTTQNRGLSSTDMKVDTTGSGRRAYHRSVAQLCWHIADALSYAHDAGIIHRDIKPANLLLDSNGHPWVADFGLVKTEDHALTQTGAFVGTLRYMAPERFQGMCDPRSDVYSLGMTLYEMIAMKPALDATDQASLLYQIQESDPPSLRAIERRIPRDLEVIVSRAIQKEPDRRYASAREFADDLDRFLDGRPILARDVSSFEKALIWARRRPAVASLLLLLLVGLVTAAIGSSIAAFEFRKIASKATLSEQDARLYAEQADAATVAEKIANRKTQSTLSRSMFLLAWSLWNDNRAMDASRLLDTIPDDDRHLEWYLSRQHFRGGYLTINSDESRIGSVCFLGDGTSNILAAATGKKISLFDANSGELTQQLKGHKRKVTVIASSLDGRWLMSSGESRQIKIWDLSSNELASSKSVGADVCSVAFSPNGRLVAATDADGRLSVWQTEDDSKVFSNQAHPRDALGVAFHPDGTIIATCGFDQHVRIWDAQTGELVSEIVRTTTGEPIGVLNCIAWSPDGRTIATAGRRGIVWFVDVATAQIRLAIRGPKSNNAVSSIGFSEDGGNVFAAKSDSSIVVCDARTGEQISTLRGHQNKAHHLAVASDGFRVVSNDDSQIKIWDIRSATGSTAYRQQQETLTSAALSRDGSTVVTAGPNSLHLWNADQGKTIAVLSKRFDGPYVKVAFSVDEQSVLFALTDGTIKRWKIGEKRPSDICKDRLNEVRDFCCSHDQKWMAVADDEDVKLIDLQSNRLIHKLSGHNANVRAVAFSLDDQVIYSGGQDGSVRAWNAKSGETLGKLIEMSDSITDLDVSPDGKTLACAINNAQISIINLKTGSQQNALTGHDSQVKFARFDPSSTRILSGGNDDTVRLWDASSGEELCRFPFAGNVIDGQFSADGSRAVVAHQGGATILNMTSQLNPASETGNLAKRIGDPNWHFLQAEASRALGDDFATVIHQAKRLLLQPEIVTAQLDLFLAAAKLKTNAPELFDLLPSYAINLAPVQIAAQEQEYPISEPVAQAIRDTTRNRVIDIGKHSFEFFEPELKLMRRARDAFSGRRSDEALSLLLYRMKRYQEAITIAQSNSPGSAIHLAVRSMSEFRLGNKRRAKDLYESLRDATRDSNVNEELKELVQETKRLVD